MIANRLVLFFCTMVSVHAFVPKTARAKYMVSFSSTSDNESTKRTTAPPSSKHNVTDANHYFYMNPKQKFEETTSTVEIGPTILEESLLSQHDAMESLLSETSTREDYVDPTKQVLGEKANTKTENESTEDSRLADSIDRSIYQFNTYLVKIVYAIISFLYPMSSEMPSQNLDFGFRKSVDAISHLSPLLGTEYNEDAEGQRTVVRFERFYILETVARIPYFAYLSVLHFRESLGNRGFLDETVANEKRVETMRTHYAQADNEVHHLLIMEALGGNSRGIDRLLAHTLAFTYYWFVVLVFLWNEQAAYHLNEIIEDHAYNTYDEFLTIHEEELKTLSVPDIARKYYESDYLKNPHLFEAFCAVSSAGSDTTSADHVHSRRENGPHELKSLYDVFMNIRDDEKEHWMSLCNIVQYGEMGAVDAGKVKSTNERRKRND